MDFAQVYDRHAPEVRRAANQVLRDRRLAEEVAHDVFLALWRDRRHDPERGPIGAYLRTLARNRAVDVWRRSQAQQRTANRYGDLQLAGPVDEPHDAAVRAEVVRRARDAVARLPEEQRRAIALTYWGGMTIAEAAAVQGIPLGTAKSRVRLALLRLATDPDLATAA